MNTIRRVVKGLTLSGELVLLQQGKSVKQDGCCSPSVWIRTAVLNSKNLTPEQALNNYYESSGLSAISKIEKIQDFIQNQEFAFTVSDIRKHFPDISKGTIYIALEKLNSEKKLILLREGEGRYYSSSVWILADVLHKKKLTMEQALISYYENSSLSTISKSEQVQQHIQSLNFAFTVSDIRKHFSDISISTIRIALNGLTSTGELKLLHEGDQGSHYNHSVWIRTAVLHKQGLTSKKALKIYYESSGLSAGSKMEQVQRFVQGLESVFFYFRCPRKFSGFF